MFIEVGDGTDDDGVTGLWVDCVLLGVTNPWRAAVNLDITPGDCSIFRIPKAK